MAIAALDGQSAHCLFVAYSLITAMLSLTGFELHLVGGGGRCTIVTTTLPVSHIIQAMLHIPIHMLLAGLLLQLDDQQWTAL